MPKRSEDAELLARFIRVKDEAAFEQIVRKYENLVWNICCRILHNRHDAEDAFQQTFLLLALKARRIRKPNSLSSWLYGVAFRNASSIRRQRQRDMLPYESMADESLTEDVLEYVARKNENELVSAEIMLMKEKLKTPLLMFYFMGDSTAQIAETLGTTISAVEGRLRQARLALRSQLRLRGVDFDTTCAALVVPVIAMSPALTAATINKVATASISSIAGTITSYLTGLNQTGAKLMLTKIALSFSILCVASMGVIQQDGAGDGEPQVTQLQSGEQAEATVGIKFVRDEDETISPEVLRQLSEDWSITWTGKAVIELIADDGTSVFYSYDPSENLESDDKELSNSNDSDQDNQMSLSAMGLSGFAVEKLSQLSEGNYRVDSNFPPSTSPQDVKEVAPNKTKRLLSDLPYVHRLLKAATLPRRHVSVLVKTKLSTIFPQRNEPLPAEKPVPPASAGDK